MREACAHAARAALGALHPTATHEHTPTLHPRDINPSGYMLSSVIAQDAAPPFGPVASASVAPAAPPAPVSSPSGKVSPAEKRKQKRMEAENGLERFEAENDARKRR